MEKFDSHRAANQHLCAYRVIKRVRLTISASATGDPALTAYRAKAAAGHTVDIVSVAFAPSLWHVNGNSRAARTARVQVQAPQL